MALLASDELGVNGSDGTRHGYAFILSMSWPHLGITVRRIYTDTKRVTAPCSECEDVTGDIHLDIGHDAGPGLLIGRSEGDDAVHGISAIPLAEPLVDLADHLVGKNLGKRGVIVFDSFW